MDDAGGRASGSPSPEEDTPDPLAGQKKMQELLEALGSSQASDPRAIFPLVRQILTIAEQPGMPPEMSLLLLDWMPVLFRASRETNSSVVQNGICRVLCIMVLRRTNVPRMLAAGLLDHVQPFLTGPHHDLRCKALKCLGDLSLADEGSTAIVQSGGQGGGAVQAILSCVANCKREEARCAALEAVAKLASSSDEARRKVAQNSGIPVLHGALSAGATNVIIGAARALQSMCRTKVARLELMKLGGLKTLSAAFCNVQLDVACQESAANVVLALVSLGVTYRELQSLSAKGGEGARRLGGHVAAGWGKLAMELAAMLQQKAESRAALKHLCDKYKLVFFVLGRPIARLDDAQQKSCYSAFVDSAKSGRGGGGRVPTRSIDVCKKARRDAVAEVVEAAPELDALPEFAFYKQLQFHRPKQAAELGLGGGATQGAGGGTEWDGAGSPSEAMGSLSVSTSLAGMLRDFADTKRLAMHIWNTAQRGVRVAGAGGGAGVRRQRPDLDEDWEAAAGGDDGQGGFRFREAAVDYDAFLLRIRDRRAGALRAEVQQECQAFLRRAPLLPTEQRGNELQELMGRLEDALLAHPLYAQAEPPPPPGAGEALERYLVKRLRAVLAARDAAQGARDAALAARLERLAAFLQPRHLDIAPSRVHPDAWAQAEEALRAFTRAVSPREKVDALLDTARHIHAAPALNGDESPLSADEFLPILILLVVRARPPELQSHIDFVANYRGAARMRGEGAYFFTHLAGAACFLESVDASRLSAVTHEEFARRMRLPHTPPAEAERPPHPQPARTPDGAPGDGPRDSPGSEPAGAAAAAGGAWGEGATPASALSMGKLDFLDGSSSGEEWGWALSAGGAAAQGGVASAGGTRAARLPVGDLFGDGGGDLFGEGDAARGGGARSKGEKAALFGEEGVGVGDSSWLVVSPRGGGAGKPRP